MVVGGGRIVEENLDKWAEAWISKFVNLMNPGELKQA
jgi:hypothetical protein